jgi:hypothetical protein
MTNKIVLYFLYILHVAISLFILVGPFVISNTNVLLSIIIINLIIVTGWHLHGYCFFTDIENMVNADMEDMTDQTKSLMARFSENYLPFIDKQLMNYTFSLVPLMSTIMCCRTLHYALSTESHRAFIS